MNDAEMLDWLEEFVNEHGALVLHTGDAEVGKHPGLGLRPGAVRRTLREAIQDAGVSRHKRPLTGPNERPAD